ncbi:hypothetical protein IW262DRAFT_1296886 [Armillaria fumosa]|nr:hypothetical protein IW262DRAFT_1296886 [Armillaria fumosa]
MQTSREARYHDGDVQPPCRWLCCFKSDPDVAAFLCGGVPWSNLLLLILHAQLFPGWELNELSLSGKRKQRRYGREMQDAEIFLRQTSDSNELPHLTMHRYWYWYRRKVPMRNGRARHKDETEVTRNHSVAAHHYSTVRGGSNLHHHRNATKKRLRRNTGAAAGVILITTNETRAARNNSVATLATPKRQQGPSSSPKRKQQEITPSWTERKVTWLWQAVMVQDKRGNDLSQPPWVAVGPTETYSLGAYIERTVPIWVSYSLGRSMKKKT